MSPWLLKAAAGWACLALAMACAPAAAAEGLADSLVAFAEGAEALGRGDSAAAVERLEEAVRLAPEDGSFRYALGLALLGAGRPAEAATALAAALAAPRPPAADRADVESALALARRAESSGEKPAAPAPVWREERTAFDRRPVWSGRIAGSVASDSNPQLLSESLLLPDGHGKLVDGRDRDALAGLDLRLDAVPVYDRGGWTLGFGLTGGRSAHRDFGYLDLSQLGATVQLARGADPRGWVDGPLGPARVPFGDDRASLVLQGGGAQWWLGSDSFLRTAGGGAGVTLRESPAAATGIDVAYLDRRFSGLYAGRSGRDASLALDQLFFCGRTDRYLRLSAAGTDRATDGTAGRPFAGKQVAGGAELALPLGLRWSLLLSGSYARLSFDHPESNLFNPIGPLGPAREDRTSRAAAALSWALTDRLGLTARAAYTRRSSNVDLGDGLPDLGYRRTELALAASWVF
ncbi:MAG TPA: hypothetical protein VOA87_02000 [Thermoanaerobaculia bacterium]|nr:hypothetical protein [Thermoanaerobaculia bacterium]